MREDSNIGGCPGISVRGSQVVNVAATLLMACVVLWTCLPDIHAQDNAGNDSITLNFDNVPLETVLEYLSEAAGYVILTEARIEGNVSVISRQPLSKDEAIDLLDTILNEKGYTAVRRGTNGRILKIVALTSAPKEDLPVNRGADPEEIPKKDVMVTQVIPIRFGNAAALIENISPLLPEYSTLNANESSNALILTDTQANINRIAQIVQALDQSISSVSSLKVFPLRYADATELAEVIKGIFENEGTQTNNDRGGGRGGFRPPWDRGRGGENDNNRSSGNSAALAVNSRVIAIAEERSNSLVVSAPSDLLPTIEQLIAEMDRNVEDITEIRVFPLENADAYEMADILTNLFSDEEEVENTRGGFRFRRGGENNRESDNTSERMLQQKKVVAVADPRTNSVIVSASSELMSQVGRMVNQLDSTSAKKQRVYTYTLEHGDVYGVADILRNMFEQQNGNFNNNANRNNQNRNNPLQTRALNNNNNTGNALRNNAGGNARGTGF